MATRQLRSSVTANADTSVPVQPSQVQKRKLRSSTKAENPEAEADPEAAQVVPPSKKRKVVLSLYLCFGCDEELLSRKFPQYNPTGECDHLINFCTDCLQLWTKTQVESALFTPCGEEGKKIGVQCPQCPKLMVRSDVRRAARSAYARFVQMERKHVADTNPGWRWCLAPQCKAGQVHESPVEMPQLAQPNNKDLESASDICTCKDCGAKACVTCDRPYHDGETCEAYQARIKDRIEEEDKSIATIKKETRKCPNPACTKNIQKAGGCKHMHCSQCNGNFCWACMAVLPAGGYQSCGCSGR